ncbi:hybrid sensor histidine kinase/response regulator [Caldimonas tepidiphila]|uniref:hybrid sensor histidine kinase/response regulator n=1 Tax=Caldimonas tepidiphila TaxID=2315841 RepID=UPI000E5C03FC|nr:hybrid sensor histidine kinase/response regulator [Caldimonas tepidiphila]
MKQDAQSPQGEDVPVLVVDDVEQNLLAMEALLARPGIRVLTARGGVEALELLLRHEVAVALLDVQMPEMDGFTLAELMLGAERTRAVPIIFLTGRTEEPQRTFRAYGAGAVDFLHKPVEPQVLLAKVGVFVELFLQRRQLRERMAELERVIRLNETMAAVLTHDLRTPLSAISLGAEIVRRSAESETVRQAGARIRSSSARMARMIDQLLDFSRIRSGMLHVEPRPGNLLATCEAAVAEIRQARPEARIDLDGQGELDAEFDPDRMMQVFNNLIDNAVQHGAAGVPVGVELDGRAPAQVRVRVRNTGTVPEQARAELFTPFRSRPQKDSAGLGLGLYIVDQFVRAHGGRVECCSGTGGETVFELQLPRRVPAAG